MLMDENNLMEWMKRKVTTKNSEKKQNNQLRCIHQSKTSLVLFLDKHVLLGVITFNFLIITT